MLGKMSICRIPLDLPVWRTNTVAKNARQIDNVWRNQFFMDARAFLEPGTEFTTLKIWLRSDGRFPFVFFSG